ncbi:MAG: hypothetical protein K2Q18_10825 [Bdellovibrionales bacterium]|nr:hypothetical protein [Bdellovibrionales bacterium]
MKLVVFIIATFLISFNIGAIEASREFSTGKLSINTKWISNQMGSDALYAFINFNPSNNTPTCQRISFIQAARVRTSDKTDYVWKATEGQSNRNHIMTKKSASIQDGFFIDHDASLCKQGKKCSPFYRDSWENNDESKDGMSLEGQKESASMLDAPFGWESFEEIKLEACAVCQEGEELKVLSCVEWGGIWPITDSKEILPLKFRKEASPTFKEALEKFQSFYKDSNF